MSDEEEVKRKCAQLSREIAQFPALSAVLDALLWEVRALKVRMENRDAAPGSNRHDHFGNS